MNNTTKHFGARRSQRGITSAMSELVLRYGEIRNDKYVMSKKLALELIVEFKAVVNYWERSEKLGLCTMNAIQCEVLTQTRNEIKILLKIADTNGVVVVESDNTLITTYKFR